MASSYSGFDVLIDNDDGTTTAVANRVVHVYDVGAGAALPDVISDAVGHVVAGALNVAAGTIVRFWVDLGDGRVGYCEAVTT